MSRFSKFSIVLAIVVVVATFGYVIGRYIGPFSRELAGFVFAATMLAFMYGSMERIAPRSLDRAHRVAVQFYIGICLLQSGAGLVGVSQSGVLRTESLAHAIFVTGLFMALAGAAGILRGAFQSPAFK